MAKIHLSQTTAKNQSPLSGNKQYDYKRVGMSVKYYFMWYTAPSFFFISTMQFIN